MRPYLPRDVRQLRRLLDRIPIGMLVTRTLDGVTHTRPMLMHDIDESGWLWFITDRDSRNACELNQNPHATITFAIEQQESLYRRAGYRHRRPRWRRVERALESQVPLMVSASRRSRNRARRDARDERWYWLLPRTRLPRVIGAAKALITGKRREPALHGVLRLHALSA